MDSLTAFKLIQEETARREKNLTEAEKTARLFEPAICGSQAWLERSTTWEMKREREERELDERKQEKEKEREREKELERQREIEREKRRKKK